MGWRWAFVVNTERHKFIWQTVWTVALAIAVTVAPSLFPNMPWWLSWCLFGGGVVVTIIAFARLYFLQGKEDVPASDVNTSVSVPRGSTENKPIPSWQIVAVLAVTWIVAGGAVIHSLMTQSEYEKGLSREEVANVKKSCHTSSLEQWFWSAQIRKLTGTRASDVFH
jgi:hypothetical protein